MDVGLLIARLVFGVLMAVHGSQKLFGWFGGPGIGGSAAFLEGLGNGLLASTNGIELPLLYLTAAVSLALTGPGGYSLDAMLGLTEWWTPKLTAIVLAGGAIGGFASLWMRRRVAAAAHG